MMMMKVMKVKSDSSTAVASHEAVVFEDKERASSLAAGQCISSSSFQQASQES